MSGCWMNNSGFCSVGSRPRPSDRSHGTRANGRAPNADHTSAANTMSARARRRQRRGARVAGVATAAAHAARQHAKATLRPALPANKAAALYRRGKFVVVFSATYFSESSLRTSASVRPNVATAVRAKIHGNVRAAAAASASFCRRAPIALPMTANSATKSAAYSASSANVVRRPLSEARRRAPAP